MEGFVLIGGFLAVALFGYYLMGRLDCFLDGVRNDAEARENSCSLKIAVSNPYAITPVTIALAELQRQYPNMEFKISIVREDDIMNTLDSGDADVVVAPYGTRGAGLAHCDSFSFRPQPLCVDAQVAVTPMDSQEQRQSILWKDISSPVPVQKFVQQLCRRSDRSIL